MISLLASGASSSSSFLFTKNSTAAKRKDTTTTSYLVMMAAIASSKTLAYFGQPSKKVGWEDDDSENADSFLDCVDKQVDVLDFLEIERDDTSVGSSSSSSTSFLDDEDDDDEDECSLAMSSADETVYLDALDDFLNDDDIDDEIELGDSVGNEPEGFDVNSDFGGALEHVSPTPTDRDRHHNLKKVEDESSSRDLAVLELPRVDETQEEGNPIDHVVHIAQDIWEGAKHTPVGIVIHVTEGVLGGVFGRLVGMIHHHDKDTDKHTKEEDYLFEPVHSTVELAAAAAAPAIESTILEVSDEAVELGILEVSDDDDSEKFCLNRSQTTTSETPQAKELKRRLDLSISTDNLSQPDSSASSQNANWDPLE